MGGGAGVRVAAQVRVVLVGEEVYHPFAHSTLR